MHMNTCLVAWFVRLISLIHIGKTTSTGQSVEIVCPDKMWSPPKCNRTCACEWSNTMSCQSMTGQCVCRSGFSNKQCSAIEDCKNSDRLCSEREYCQNTKGSFTCTCLPGFRRSSVTDICEPCGDVINKDTCSRTCNNCHPKNTISCDRLQGMCICKPGWESPWCDVSVDDCVGNPCSTGTCKDRHQGYVCKCETGFLMIKGKCEEYRTDFITSNFNPDVGELIDVYILFYLPALYHANVLMGDDFISVMHGGESVQSCDISLHRHNQMVFGDEAFFDLFDKNQPRPIEYHYYSSYKVRFTTEGQKTLLIDPYPFADHPLTLKFNVQYKSKSVKDCFLKMFIDLISPYPIDPINNLFAYMKRQSYETMRVNFNDSKRCTEMPQFRWHYSLVEEQLFKDNHNVYNKAYCMFAKYFKPLDIISLVQQSGGPEITDHMSEQEIIPPNTLPLGTILICVSGYIQNDTKSSATACGFIQVTHSNIILGSIVPRRSRMSLDNEEDTVHLSTQFWDPDDPLQTLRYVWTCIPYSYTKLGKMRSTVPCEFKDGSDSKASVSVELNTFWSKGVIVVVVYNEKLSYITNEIEINRQRKWNFTIDIDITPHPPMLGPKIPISKEVFLIAESSQLSWNKPSVKIHWQMKQNTWIKETQLASMVRDPLDSHFFRTKINTLTPNATYRVRVTALGATSYAEFKFETESVPSGGQCVLKRSKTAYLVNERFTFECRGFTDVDQRPLVYRLLQKDWIGGVDPVDVLIGYSSTGLIPDLTLSRFVPGNVTGGEMVTVELTWEVTTPTGSVNTSSFNVTMKLGTDLDLSDILNPKSEEHRQSNSQENLRRHKDIATMINLEWTKEITNVNFALIRQQLLRNMNNKRPMSLSTVRLKSYVMGAILERDEEIIAAGLEDGLETVVHLVGYIHQFENDTFIFMDVIRSQFHCLERLLRVLHEHAHYYHDHSEHHGDLTNRGLQKIKEQSIKLTEAVTRIGESYIMCFYCEKGHIDEEGGVIAIHVKELLKFGEVYTLYGKTAAFVFVDQNTELKYTAYVLYQEYQVNPFEWASEHVIGELPVVDIRFYVKKDHKVTFLDKWSFGTEAQLMVFIEEPTPEIRQIPLNLVVNSQSQTILMSGCVTMVIKASTTMNTLLSVKSLGNLTMKVQTILATTSESFDGLSDEDILDFPLQNASNLRSPDLIYLPQISSRRVSSPNENYHVRITIKKGQDIANATFPYSSDDSPLNLLLQENVTELHTTTIIVSAYSMSCFNFDLQDRSLRNDACRVAESSQLHIVSCSCWRAGTIAPSVRAQNSLLDNTEITIEVFDNPLVNFMVAGLWVIFLVSLLWAKKKDKLDSTRNKATILEDNGEGDKYVYLVCISTGTSMTSAPSADVFMYFKGTNSSTRPHVFWDRYKVTFQPGSDEWFIMTTSVDIGDVTSVVVWTADRGGEKEDSWHLIAVYIENILTKQAWVCRYNGWLSRSSDREDIVEIPARDESELLQNKRTQMMSKCSQDLRNYHLWVGVIGKSPYDKFTRARRLATALTVMQLLMTLNIVLFDFQDFFTRYRLRPHTDIHMASVTNGLHSSFYSTIIGLVIAFLFSRCADRKSGVVSDSKDQRNISQNALEDGGAPQIPHAKKDSGGASNEVPPTNEEQDPDKTKKTTTPGAEEPLAAPNEPSVLSRWLGRNKDTEPKDSDKTKKTTTSGEEEPQAVPNEPSVLSRWLGRDKDTEPKDSDKTKKTTAPGEEEPMAVPNEPSVLSRWLGRDKDTEPKNQQTTNERGPSGLNGPLEKTEPKNHQKTKEKRNPGLKGPMEDLIESADMHSTSVHSSSGQSFRTALSAEKEFTPNIQQTIPKMRAERGTIKDRLLKGPNQRLSMMGRVMAARLTAGYVRRAQKTTYKQTPEWEPFSLPWWFVIFVWLYVLGLNIFLSNYMVLHGYEVSYRRSLDFLVAFLFGILCNVVLYQPLAIIISGYVLVQVFGKKYPYYTRGPLERLEETRKRIKAFWRADTFRKRECTRQTTRGDFQLRCSQSVAKDIMRRLRIEGDARQILRDLVGYSLFLVSALYLINNYMRITPRFWITDILRRAFLKNVNVDKGMNISAMWDHFSNTVLPVLKGTESDSIQIENTYIFGTARLRQVRIVQNKGICEDLMERLVAYYSGVLCTQSVNDGEEETRSFKHSWDNPVPKTDMIDLESPYTYRSAEDLEHRYHHIGEHGFYSAGGFITLITPDEPFKVVGVLSSLRTTGWIDQFTRCLFFEFTLYHPNLNLISGVSIAFEFVNYGAIYPTANFETSSLMFFNTDWETVLAEVILCVGILYYTYAAYKAIREHGFKYFHNIWHLMEISLLLLSFSAAGLMLLLNQAHLDVTEKYNKHGNTRYTDFSEVFDLEESMQRILGCLGALIILKTFKLITFSPFMAKFSRTIEISVPNLAGYLLLTIIFAVAFSCTGSVLFGTMMLEYSTVWQSMFAHIRFVLGVPDLQSMFLSKWVLGRIFAVLGLGVTKYIIINVFISILRESFGLANQMTYRDEETTVIYVKNLAVRFFGITEKPR